MATRRIMASTSAFDELPPHLKRVLRFLARGATNPEIAAALGLAVHSVDNYVHEIRSRTGFKDRSKLVLAALAWGYDEAQRKALFGM